MKQSVKRGLSALIAASFITGAIPVMGAADVTFKTNADGKAEATITEKSGIDKIAIAQYDNLGRLINMGVSPDGGTTATTLKPFSWSPYNRSKIIMFSDWDKMQTEEMAYRLGTRTLGNETFEIPHDLQLARGDHTLEVVAGEGNGGGSGLYFKNKEGSLADTHASMNGARSVISDFVVYEVDIRLVSANTHAHIYIMGGDDPDGAENNNTILYINPNSATGATSTTVNLGANKDISFTMNTGVWYTVSASVNYKDYVATYTVKQGDTVVATYTGGLADDFGYGEQDSKPAGLRVHTASRYWQPVTHEFYIDNMRVYEGTEPRNELNDLVYIIDTDTTQTVFESEDEQKSALSGTLAVHSRSGVAYNGESKTLLNFAPYTEKGEVYVPLGELANVWGVNITGVTINSKGYAKLTDIATALGKNLYVDTKAKYNNGMCVIGESFTYPTEAEALQRLNDFLFYLRPTEEQIQFAYNEAGAKGMHPRLLGNPGDFARIKAEYKKGTNAAFMAWARGVISSADYLKQYPAGTQWFEDHFGYDYYGGRIGSPVTWSVRAAAVYAMAYQLTGDRTYTDRLYEVLVSMGSFPNWNPNHHLDPARISLGFSIAYDWCYDAWTTEQKEFIENAVYSKLFYEAAEGYKSEMQR